MGSWNEITLRHERRKAEGRALMAENLKKIRVLVRPKEGILDPQGVAVERALPSLGFDGVSNVHVGRLIELDVGDVSQVDAMCQKLLANPLVEDYEIVS